MQELTIPAGFSFSATHAGLKKAGKADFALIHSDVPATVAGVFTRNKVVAAPVILTREQICGGLCRTILVNSGNANACTGKAGLKDAHRCAELVAAGFQIDPGLVAVASTGVIGQPLPMLKLESALPGLFGSLGQSSPWDVAEAMRTTDSFAKVAGRTLQVAGRDVSLLGLAKGAGMIHPNMATMLGFVMTDAAIEAGLLQEILRAAVDRSFNAITVDRDTSTNDMVLVLANGCSGAATIEAGSAAAAELARQLDDLLLELAKMIVKDGEGATKLVEVRVTGAENTAEARQVAESIATSNLVKTAFFGADANWGRIIAAAGYSGAEVDPERVKILFDRVLVADQGLSVGPEVEEAAAAVLQQDEFVVTIDLGLGVGSFSYYTSDLTYDYVRINADYRT